MKKENHCRAIESLKEFQKQTESKRSIHGEIHRPIAFFAVNNVYMSTTSAIYVIQWNIQNDQPALLLSIGKIR